MAFARTILVFTFIAAFIIDARGQSILVEAENFTDRGGWVIDQQSMDQMGSPYLLAHGMGVPVKDATASVRILGKGTYRVWVRTRDWVAPWKMAGAPGKFRLVINNKSLKTVFGTEGEKWHWQYGGRIHLEAGDIRLVLQDLTGFEGRCDAVFLTCDPHIIPPEEPEKLAVFRREMTGMPDIPEDAGFFDLLVIGGGMAGICSAVSAARLGCKVAFIHNRPVLGGNNSSEVRVGLSGLIHQQPYPQLGNLVDEIGSVGHWNIWEANQNPESPRSKRILEIVKNHPEKKIHNAGPASNYGDDNKLYMIENEPNISLFLNTHIYSVEKSDSKIVSVTCKNITSGKELRFRGDFFADCTGDGNVGFLAGADFRQGRESKIETGETLAPDTADNLVMGTSIQWYAEDAGYTIPFPDCPWAVKFSEETCQKGIRGDWNWETGMARNQVEDMEFIRDYGLRAVYGNWSFLKNSSAEKGKYASSKLVWVAYIGGKRESRRLLGDIILTGTDISQRTPFPDACFTTTWPIDLHYPVTLKNFEEAPFLAVSDSRKIKPYAVPYRCLYSRNIDNLFMAGRNISVTHVALGTIRVQRTTGMMGEVVGMAASICKSEKTGPRGVYQYYLSNLKKLLAEGVPK